MNINEIKKEYKTKNLHKNTIKNIEKLLLLLSDKYILLIDDAYCTQHLTFSIIWEISNVKNIREFSLEIGYEDVSYYYETTNQVKYYDNVPINNDILINLKLFYSNNLSIKIKNILK
jgi:hypothetical protein